MRLRWLVMGIVLSVAGLGECQDAMFRGNLQHHGIYEAAGVSRFEVYFGSADGNVYALM